MFYLQQDRVLSVWRLRENTFSFNNSPKSISLLDEDVLHTGNHWSYGIFGWAVTFWRLISTYAFTFQWPSVASYSQFRRKRKISGWHVLQQQLQGMVDHFAGEQSNHGPQASLLPYWIFSTYFFDNTVKPQVKSFNGLAEFFASTLLKQPKCL